MVIAQGWSFVNFTMRSLAFQQLTKFISIQGCGSSLIWTLRLQMFAYLALYQTTISDDEESDKIITWADPITLTCSTCVLLLVLLIRLSAYERLRHTFVLGIAFFFFTLSGFRGRFHDLSSSQKGCNSCSVVKSFPNCFKLVEVIYKSPNHLVADAQLASVC